MKLNTKMIHRMLKGRTDLIGWAILYTLSTKAMRAELSETQKQIIIDIYNNKTNFAIPEQKTDI